MDLSEDSREIVCGSIGSENGTVYSKVYLLSTYSDEDAQECRIDGSALVDIKLMGRKAVATCNNGRTVFTFRNSGVTQEHNDFSSDITAFYSDKSGNTAVVTNKVGYFGTKEITVYNKNNEITYIGYTDEEIVDVICRGKRAYLLTDKAIYESLSDGTFRVAGTKEISGEGMVICKGRLYYYSTGNIDINS